MIIGRWYINALLWYIWVQVSNLSKVISDLMVSTWAFFTIPEVELIYYTTDQPGVQPHRLNPQQGIKNYTTYSLSLTRWNGPQVRNTHSTLSENSEQWSGNMVYFFLPLETISQNTRISGMKGNFKFWFKSLSLGSVFSQHGILVLRLL